MLAKREAGVAMLGWVKRPGAGCAAGIFLTNFRLARLRDVGVAVDSS